MDWIVDTRQIPSVLLPLKLSGFRVNAKIDVPPKGGGIAVVGDKIVIADRLYQFHIFNQTTKKMRSASYPQLPNNRKSFLEWGKYSQVELFRVHDIEYMDISGKSFLIVSHEFFDTDNKSTHLALHRLEINPKTLSSNGDWEQIFRSSALPVHADYFANAAGGRIAIGRDKIFLSIGDYAKDGVFTKVKKPFPAQNRSNDFGSIISLNVKNWKASKISYGHRNPQGLAFTFSGELISTEHGPRGGDELNLIKTGRNYGWPEVSLGTDYPTYSWPFSRKQGRHDGYELPLFSWVPSIGVSNLIEIQNFDERWDDDLLVSSLKGASLFRLRRNGDNIVYSEPIWIGQRVRDLAQTKDSIVMWTDQSQLLFLSKDQKQLLANNFLGIPTVSPKLSKCVVCHHFGKTTPSHAAPSLSNLVNRPVASDPGFNNYSDALKKLGGKWTRTRLTKLLTSPNSFAPGINMVMEPLTNLRQVRHLIDELERAK